MRMKAVNLYRPSKYVASHVYYLLQHTPNRRRRFRIKKESNKLNKFIKHATQAAQNILA